MQFTSGFIAGQLLLWTGFLGGSLAAVCRLENESAPWQTIPWGWYLASAAVGVAGVILLRREKSLQSARSAASGTGLDSVKHELAQVAHKVSRLEAELPEMTCEQVLDYIDGECVPHLAEFADGRQVISDRFGTQMYASVMTEFASGERYLNRAWSAAADGYVDEVAASVGHANTFFQAADGHLPQAVSPT